MGLLIVLFNIGFWVDEWSTDGTAVNEVSQICFEQHGEYCCQTFEDLKQQTPDWVGHQRRSMIAAYIGVFITSVVTGMAFFLEWHFICLIILMLTTCLSVISTLAAIGLFNENFSDIPGFQHQKLGSSFWLFLVCFFLQVLLPVMVFIEWTDTIPDLCKRIWNDDPITPIDRKRWKENNVEPINSSDINIQFTRTHYKKKENEDLIIKCSVQQRTDWRRVKWRRRYNGVHLKDVRPDLDHRYTIGRNPQPSLTIKRLQPKDNCEFQCRIEKKDGWIYESDFIQVEVLYKPKITELVSRSMGSTLTLTCNVDANPTVLRVRWVKINGANEKILQEDKNLDISATHSLTYKKKLNVNDSGDYKCQAENDIGWGVSSSVSVRVGRDTDLTAEGIDCQVAISRT